MSRFLGKVVFVTGGTSGLGATSCQLFINEGATVFVTDIEERSILQKLGSDKPTTDGATLRILTTAKAQFRPVSNCLVSRHSFLQRGSSAIDIYNC